MDTYSLWCDVDVDGESMFHHTRNVAFRRHHLTVMRQRSSDLDGTANPASQDTYLSVPLSYAGINLKMLGQLLNFSDMERAWLLWSYCARDGGLTDLPVANEEHANALLGRLLNVPLEEVRAAAMPNRLVALQLLDGVHADAEARPWFAPWRLSDWLVMSPRAVALLSQPQRSHASLLNALMAPDLVPDVDVFLDAPAHLLHEWFPPLVAEAYQLQQRWQPLEALHLAAVMTWCTNVSMPIERFTELVGHIGITGMREAIKRAVFACCQLQRPVTPFVLLKAVYATAR